MTETEFLTRSSALLARIEEAVEATGVEADIERKGDGILELEFDNGSKIVINSQTPMRQIWVAAKSGGFHFECKEEAWLDTRSGEALFDTLSRVITEQSGERVRLSAP
jgi:CyaY protein